MSRKDALRVLLTAADVPASSRRTAELMLAGPEITLHDERTIRHPRLPQMTAAVELAARQIGAEYDDARRAAAADLREIAGVR